MRFNMGEDALDDEDGYGGDEDMGMGDEEADGLALR